MPYQSSYYNSSWKKTFKYRLWSHSVFVGKGLYQIWNALCLLIEHKYEMGTIVDVVGENGNMNISIEEVEKLSVLYTLKKIPLALWLY